MSRAPSNKTFSTPWVFLKPHESRDEALGSSTQNHRTHMSQVDMLIELLGRHVRRRLRYRIQCGRSNISFVSLSSFPLLFWIQSFTYQKQTKTFLSHKNPWVPWLWVVLRGTLHEGFMAKWLRSRSSTCTLMTPQTARTSGHESQRKPQGTTGFVSLFLLPRGFFWGFWVTHNHISFHWAELLY